MSRRGGHDDGGAHGGSWKIALADLMTVLMVFFLVMWLLAVVEPEKRKTFAESLTGKYEEPVAVVEDSAKQDGSELNPLDLKPPATELEIRQSLKTMNQRDIEIEDGPEFTRITLKSDSFFESGRATISDKTREQLENLGETLAGRGQKMVISGYTDDIPINNFQFPSNWELSAARAATVARTFIYMGVDQTLIKIEGNADNDPVVPNDSSYSRSVNRRVIITVDKRPPVEVKKPLPVPARPLR